VRPEVAPPGDELAIGHEWARRRLDLYGDLERAMREGISRVMQTAAEIRADVEQDATAYLGRLAAERTRLTEAVADLEARRAAAEDALKTRQQEIEAELSRLRAEGEAALEQQRRETEEGLRAQRETAEAEVATLRQTAAEEVATLRQTAEAEVTALRTGTRDEIDRMVREAEARRAQVATEVRALEEQVAQIQGVIDSFLDSQLQTLRGSLGASRGRPAGGAPRSQPSPVPPAAAGPLGPAGPPRQAVPASPAGAGAEADDDGGEAEDDAAWAPPSGVAGGATPAPPGARPGAPGGAPGERTEVVISGVPHFSRARGLWQAIQGVPGVTEARALNYQAGVLTLEVHHDPAVDLAASVTGLPGTRLRLAEAGPGQVHLTAEA
jgi:hypothetical protein